ncbi:RICIN domain-containing protein [Parafrankia sp. FMc2]|uniref:RICIN domain-containing protein n=1 Tax=Parafrankia sp. FMc2 TaxID=3233196 RepID=UPI0034D71C8D
MPALGHGRGLRRRGLQGQGLQGRGLRRWQLAALFACTLVGASVLVGTIAAHSAQSYYSWDGPPRLVSQTSQTSPNGPGRGSTPPDSWPDGIVIAPLTPGPAGSAAEGQLPPAPGDSIAGGAFGNESTERTDTAAAPVIPGAPGGSSGSGGSGALPRGTTGAPAGGGARPASAAPRAANTPAPAPATVSAPRAAPAPAPTPAPAQTRAPAAAPAPSRFTFVNQSDGRCLGSDAQYNAFSHSCSNGPDQQWTLYLGTTTWVINRATGMCLDSNNAGHVYVMPCSSSRAYQNWRLVDLGGGLFSFVNQPTGRCLGADAGYPYTRAYVSVTQMKWKRIG